ncbi:MAG: LptF/LptG family permease [Trueperaceae bacterium]
MNVWGRALAREIAPLYVLGLMVLTLLLLLSFLLDVLADVVSRGVPAGTVAAFLLLKLPSAAAAGLPLALLFAALLALSRATQDGELRAALQLGVSPVATVRPILVVGAAVALLTLANNELLVPWAEQRALEVQREILLRSPETVLRSGAFFEDALGRSIFLQRVTADGELEGITVIASGGSQGPRQLIEAARGVADPAAGVWRLEDLRLRSFRSGRTVIDVRAESALLPVRGLTAGVVGSVDLVTLPLPELLRRVREGGRDTAAELTALHRKAAEPAAALAFALFAAAVAFAGVHRAAPLGLVSVFVLTFVYYATWSVAKLLGAQGTVPAVVAGWAPVALYAVAGAALLLRAVRR